MGWELAGCEATLLREIAEPSARRRDVAQTYALALRSGEAPRVDWAAVNRAIVARWSRSALEWIKRQAHSGRCFESPESHGGE